MEGWSRQKGKRNELLQHRGHTVSLSVCADHCARGTGRIGEGKGMKCERPGMRLEKGNFVKVNLLVTPLLDYYATGITTRVNCIISDATECVEVWTLIQPQLQYFSYIDVFMALPLWPVPDKLWFHRGFDAGQMPMCLVHWASDFGEGREG